ncbi:MAG: 8-amino-7-oxononanoate synthase [Pirellulales bacterium]
MSSWMQFFHETRRSLIGEHRLRVRKARDRQAEENPPACTDGSRVEPACDPETRSHTLIDFSTNDYLGLARSELLITSAKAALDAFGSGSGASPLVSGYTSVHEELDRVLADWFHTESAVCFSSGYAANVGVVPALVGEGDWILSDRLNHASLIDGCRLSKAECTIYPHGDWQTVTEWLRDRRAQYRRVLIVTESVFSMDGDTAPLIELATAAEQFDAGLVVDEAHAVGVYGTSGGGWIEELRLTKRILLKLGTLSKSLGSCGGYAAGSSTVIEHLVNTARSYIFSTAMPPHVAAAARKAAAIVAGMNDERARLRAMSKRLRVQLREQNWNTLDGDSPIIPVIVGDSEGALRISQRLRDSGLIVPAIRPPTVPHRTARLRISLSASHTDEELSRLIRALGRYASD